VILVVSIIFSTMYSLRINLFLNLTHNKYIKITKTEVNASLYNIIFCFFVFVFVMLYFKIYMSYMSYSIHIQISSIQYHSMFFKLMFIVFIFTTLAYVILQLNNFNSRLNLKTFLVFLALFLIL
jgi:hypothetical protein